jgi:formylglycine-generating enzyme required for sulfatase activity
MRIFTGWLLSIFDQEAIKQIGEGLPSIGLVLFSVLMLIAATFFLFYARKRFFQQQQLCTVLLGFSVLMWVLPIGYLVVNYDILHFLSQVGTRDKVTEVFAAAYASILSSVILVFLPIPLTAYALRPNRQNGWRWPAIVLNTLSIGLAYVLLLLVTGLLLVFLDGGLAFNAIPVERRYLLLLVAGLLVGHVIYAQFRVYQQQRQWFSLACFSIVYGFLFFGLVWVLLGNGVWIDQTFTLTRLFGEQVTFRRVVPYYEMADGLTLLVSVVALGLAMVNGRQTYQTQRYLLSGIYWLASLVLVIFLAIYIPAYGSMLPFLMLVLGSLLLLSYGIGHWLDNRRSWIARGAAVILALAVVAWLVLSNLANKLPEPTEQQGPEVKQPHQELSQIVMLTRKQAKKMAQRFVNQTGRLFRDRLKDSSEGPKMIWLPAGTFQMGDIQGSGDDDEQPVHEVSVEKFAIGRYEVTFAEYDKFASATGRNKPSDRGWGRGNRPVINISWHDATAYAKWLSEQTGYHYSLPTEAQWEYAARAGTTTKYWWGNGIGTNRANCGGCGDSFQYTAPAGSFEANPFGLFDTAGNVWEWTCSKYQNKYTGEEQRCVKSAGRFAARGASWFSSARWARSAYRNWDSPTLRYDRQGVRLVRMP